MEIKHNTETHTMEITFIPLVSDSFTAERGEHIQLHLINTTSEDTGSVAITITDTAGDITANGIIHLASGDQWKYTPSNARAPYYLPLTQDDHQTLAERCAALPTIHYHNTTKGN